MPTPTFTALATITLSSSASSVTFSSIDTSTYRDLVLVINGNLTGSGSKSLEFSFNGDTTAANYSQVDVYNTTSTTASKAYVWLSGDGPDVVIMNIMDAGATDKQTTVLHRGNNPVTSQVTMSATRWANTAAITSVAFQDTGGFSIEAGTTLSLFGIEA